MEASEHASPQALDPNSPTGDNVDISMTGMVLSRWVGFPASYGLWLEGSKSPPPKLKQAALGSESSVRVTSQRRGTTVLNPIDSGTEL